MIRKLKSGQFRLYSRKPNPKTGKRRNLGTFRTRAGAEKHERGAVFQARRLSPFAVMPGLVPGIHVFEKKRTWMAGTSPAMTTV